MHRNFFLFEKQIRQLAPLLRDKQIQNIYTYRKNEIVIIFSDEEAQALKISIDVNYPYFILENSGMKGAHFDLFKQLRQQQIKTVSIQKFDKYIKIETNDYTIDIVFYGKQPNIFIYNKDKLLIDSFKEAGDLDLPKSKPTLNFRNVHELNLKSLFKNEPGQKLNFFLKRHFTAFNNTIVREILFRLNIAGHTCLHDLPADFLERLIRIFKKIENEMDTEEAYIYYKEARLIETSPFHLFHLARQEEIAEKSYETVNEAWGRYVQQKRQQDAFDRLNQRIVSSINKHKEYLQRSLQKMKENENLLERKKIAELKGNLLFTYKTEIKKGQSQVMLKNIFNDAEEEITIKLNPTKDVVENANVYFNKFKNISQRREMMQIKKHTYTDELRKILEIESKLSQIQTLPKLKKIYDTMVDMKIIQVKEERKSTLSLQYSFNRLILDNEWDVYIGKNGMNNDLLTFQFANKWDIWFHAQGVSGSHVIIHLPRKNYHPPQNIIEKAAGLAAANSRSKHSSTVPVIFTEVRHVHRIRKAHPGTVSVRNEKVIFVEPLS